MSATRSHPILRLLIALFAVALLAAACGGSGDDGSAADDASGDDAGNDDSSTGAGDDSDGSDDGGSDDGGSEGGDDSEPAIELTDSWRGVTSETITLGLAMLNFEILTDLNLSPNGWGDQQGVWQALIDDLNAKGGINGRMIEPVYEFYSPIDGADAERACAALTEDVESFAVLGGFVGPLAGTADPCIVGLNETTLVGGEINNEELSQARAPWYTVGPTVEFQTVNLLNAVVETGEADGAVAFVMGGAAAADEEAFVISALEDRGIEVVGSAIIEAPDGDTVAQDNELAVAFERFVSSGANTLMLIGTPSAQIRGAAAAGLNGQIKMWSNDSGGLENLGATITDKSIADGVLVSAGPTEVEIWNDAAFQSDCVEPLLAGLPDADIRSPDTYVAGEENYFLPLRRYCTALSLFVQVATEAGGDLTPTSFEAAAMGPAFDDFAIPGVGPASLSPEKLGAQDFVRLQAYDSSVGDGTLVAVTDLVDGFN